MQIALPIPLDPPVTNAHFICIESYQQPALSRQLISFNFINDKNCNGLNLIT